MCVSTLYRLAVDEQDFYSRNEDVRKTAIKHAPYINGGFIFGKKDPSILKYFAAVFPSEFPDLQEIPCGQCIECRLNYAKMWAQRSIAEAQMSARECYFLTLTYDDDHIPEPILTFPRVVPSGHLANELMLLSPYNQDDITGFLKRLRSRFSYSSEGESGVRFLWCAEYGETTARPHFHMLLFNIKLEDLELAFNRSLMTGKDIPYFKSKLLNDCWRCGFVSVSPLTWENAAYTCRYVLKKKVGYSEKEYLIACKDHGVLPLPPERINMSRRPGIGRAYYEENKGFIYNFDMVVLPDGRTAKPCSYYDKLFDLEYPEDLEKLKFERKRKIHEQKLIDNLKSPKTDQERAKKKERSLKRMLKKLKREL